MKDLMKAMLQLFSGWVIFLHYVFYTGIFAGYLYFVSKNPIPSIIVGAILAIPSLYFISYLNKKAKRENQVISDLNQYCTTLTFQLQSGKNVASALNITKGFTSLDLQREIDKTIKKKEKTATLNTENFKKYKFPALNAFHANLKMIDEKGGDARVIFGRANKLINDAITDRDLQVRKKNATALLVHTMLGITAIIPILLKLFVGGQYSQYIELPSSTLVLSLYTTGIMITVFLTERRKTRNDMTV